MKMSALKMIICSFLLGTTFLVFINVLNHISGLDIPPMVLYVFSVSCFFLGGWLGRYISWGWLLGGLMGALLGLYGLLITLALLWEGRSYEDGLGYLLLSAGVGMLMGGYALSRVFKNRGRR